MTHLFLVRHGETPWTREKRYQGWTDTELSEFGRRQAEKLAERFSGQGIHKIYASNLLRARETAEVIGTSLGKKVHSDPRLREIGFGKWEGKTGAQLIKEKDPAFSKWSKSLEIDPPGGENMAAFRSRVRSFARHVLTKDKNKKVLIVGHGGSLKMMIFELLDLPAKSLWAIRMEPAAVSLVLTDRYFTQLNYLNDVSHLQTLKEKWRKS